MTTAHHPTTAFSARRIAEILAPDGEAARMPTPEQAAIIEQPLDGTVLVIAGAGSGKTETMANRVVWLVANGLVAPSKILGLTFTRKAAGELNERVAQRLVGFGARLEELRSLGRLRTEEDAAAVALSALLADGLDLPNVSTYNAFASGIVQEFGALAGVASSVTIIDEAAAWRIARDVVRRSTDPDVVAGEYEMSTLVTQAMELDHAVSDNLTDFAAVERAIAEYEQVEQWPHDDPKKQARRPSADVLKTVAAVRATRVAARLAEAFSSEKRSRGLIEFSDQLALAVETIEKSPEAVATIRNRTSVVLLDEVQDTSVGQTRLLATLFGGTPVMAVGDPHQSIYGFRGASASNLLTFHDDFDSASGGARGRTLNLSVSWRNPTAVLTAANCISQPLSERLAASAGAALLTVKPLQSREDYLRAVKGDHEHAEPGMRTGGADAPPADAAASAPPRVEVRFTETMNDEFDAVAEWMADARDEHLARTGNAPTAAVVLRARAKMVALQEALHRAGVPSRIVGLGGLLTTPEVTDLVSTLRCLWYADATSDLIRVLSGPRFRIGVADLVGLTHAARWFASHDLDMRPLPPEDLERSGVLGDPEREVTIIDALDEIAGMGRLDRPSLGSISETGRERLRDAGLMLRRLRQYVGGNLFELLRLVEHELRIDIELEANERLGHAGAAVARANLDAFAEVVESFLAVDDHGTLASLLEWLEKATENDGFAEHVPEPEPGTVQLITAHGAKGLEWDLVAIPRLVDDEFPAAPREGHGWLRAGQLPDRLRGDIAARPSLDWNWLASQRTQEPLADALKSYQAALRDRHADEERRLAYVAMTRAASRLLLSGSFWSTQTKPRLPSVYLRELAGAGIIGALPEASVHTSNPASERGRTVEWPRDPLGARADAVLAAAQRVRDARDRSLAPAERPHNAGGGVGADVDAGVSAGIGTGAGGPAHIAEIDPVVELLLAEHRAAQSAPSGAPATSGGLGTPPNATRVATGGNGTGHLPERITASTFHEFIEDPEDAERRRLRPIPIRPYRRTRTGNLFHEWVERRATTARGTAIPLAGFEHEHSDELAELIAHFERSRWATLQPIAVELEVTLPFAGRSLVCKLDAVYEIESEGAPRIEVVDWKSGRPPATDAEREIRFLQLDLYRHAYAQWAGIDADRIDVSLFYVADGIELRGTTHRSLEELEHLWLDAAARGSGDGSGAGDGSRSGDAGA